MGTPMVSISKAIAQYVYQHGPEVAHKAFQTLSWTRAEGGDALITPCNFIGNNGQFCTTLEADYQISMGKERKVNSDAELVQFYTQLFNERVNLSFRHDYPNSSTSMAVCLYVPLWDEALCQEAKRQISLLTNMPQDFVVDVLGFSEELAHIFTPEAEKELLPGRMEQYKATVNQSVTGLLATDGLHRLLLLEDACCTTNIALNLNEQSLTRICGEMAQLMMEDYQSLFPQLFNHQKAQLTSFGLSVLQFDRYYFVHYLLRKAYMSIMDREQVTKQSVNVDLVSPRAKELIRRHIAIFGDFYKREVEPKLQLRMNAEDIVTQVTPKIETEIQQVKSDLISFMEEEELSLPDKQALMAQLMGEDDALLEGVQLDRKQPIYDDCEAESIQVFIDQNNTFIQTEKIGESVKTMNSILKGPFDESGRVYLPLEELKHLRSGIRQSTAYIRSKYEELESIEQLLGDETERKKRLTDEGFVFGEHTYKLLGNEPPVLFDETYAPAIGPMPDSVDMRSQFTPIKSQGSLGACSAFAMVSIFEFLLKKSKSKNPDLSERFVYYNARKNAGKIVDVGSTFYDIVQTMSQEGVCQELLCPYTMMLDAPDPAAYEDGKKRLVKVVKNVKIAHKDIASALRDGYPVAISLTVYDSFGDEGHQGFIFRPTDEELKSGDSGRHAMVIVGYSDEQCVYIVRNSWGTDFGKEGYCFIPYSYVDDPSLCNQACIVTEVASVDEEIDTRIVGQQKAVSFNTKDEQIRAAILRILIGEEQQKLQRNEQRYSTLRTSYDLLVQSLCNPSTRDEIEDQAAGKLESDIQTSKQNYEQAQADRSKKIKSYKDETFKRCMALGAVFVAVALGSGLDFYYQLGDYVPYWILPGAAILTLLCLMFYWAYRRHYLSELQQELEEQAARFKAQIQEKQYQRDTLHLKLHIVGAFIDKLQKLKISLIQQYQVVTSYVGNLKVWYDQEKRAFDQMEISNEIPCRSVLEPQVLDRYFEQHKTDIIQQMHLCDFVKDYRLDEDVIMECKRQLKQQLITLLERQYKDFNILEYLLGQQYPFLAPLPGIDKMLPALETGSDPFIRLKVNKTNAGALLCNVYLPMLTDGTRQAWESASTSHFVNTPAAYQLASRYKIVEVQMLVIEDGVVERL